MTTRIFARRPSAADAGRRDRAATLECPLCRREWPRRRAPAAGLAADLVRLVLANTPGWQPEPRPLPRLRGALRRRARVPSRPRRRFETPGRPSCPPPCASARSTSTAAAASPSPSSTRVLRPSRSRRAERPHRPVRGHHQLAAAARGHRAARRLELARHDDLGRRLRERPSLERLLPRRRLRGAARAGQGRAHEPHPARQHPARPRLGDPQPRAVRHPHRQRELRRRLRGVLPAPTGCPRPRSAPRAAGSSSAPRSGNQGHLPGHPVLPPASAPSALTVGGLDDQNRLAFAGYEMYHSSYGPTVDGLQKPEVIAPGIWVAAPILPGTPDRRPGRSCSRTSPARATASCRRSSRRTRGSTPTSTPRPPSTPSSSASSSGPSSRATTSSPAPTSTSTAPASRRRSSPRSRRR